jgi:hypothetical protein
MEDIVHHGFELPELLSPRAYQAFTRHWIFFKHKLSRASGYLSLHNYNHSVYYMQMIQADVTALHHLLALARYNMHQKLECLGSSGHGGELSMPNGLYEGTAAVTAFFLFLLLLLAASR